MIDEIYKIYFVDNSVDKLVGKNYKIYTFMMCSVMVLIVHFIFNSIINVFNLSQVTLKFFELIILLILSFLIFSSVFKYALNKSGYSNQSFFVDFTEINMYRRKQLKIHLDAKLNKKIERIFYKCCMCYWMMKLSRESHLH